MEMGKLTAKLRDAVPVCFLVEDKEIKRYKNIEIPDELKKLEYQDFNFEVPTSGPIIFKINFAPGVLPEVFPQVRERRTRMSKDAPVAVIAVTPTIEPSDEAMGIETESTETINESTQEPATLIIIEEAPAVEMLENATQQGASNEAASTVAVQASEEAKPEAHAVLEDKEATLIKKAATKPKKAPAIVKGSKD